MKNHSSAYAGSQLPADGWFLPYCIAMRKKERGGRLLCRKTVLAFRRAREPVLNGGREKEGPSVDPLLKKRAREYGLRFNGELARRRVREKREGKRIRWSFCPNEKKEKKISGPIARWRPVTVPRRKKKASKTFTPSHSGRKAGRPRNEGVDGSRISPEKRRKMI